MSKFEFVTMVSPVLGDIGITASARRHRENALENGAHVAMRNARTFGLYIVTLRVSAELQLTRLVLFSPCFPLKQKRARASKSINKIWSFEVKTASREIHKHSESVTLRCQEKEEKRSIQT